MINAVIALNYNSPNLGLIPQLVNSAGVFINTLQVMNQKGIARAMNHGIKLCGYANFYTFLANDIKEPEDWLMMRSKFMKENGHVGICSFPLSSSDNLYISQDLIGNYTISRKLYEAIGEFNESFDPYGPIDLDYCHRARKAGFKTMYIPGYYSHHPHEHGTDNKYGYSKKKMIEDKWGQHVKDVLGYESGEKSIYIINQSEWQCDHPYEFVSEYSNSSFCNKCHTYITLP